MAEYSISYDEIEVVLDEYISESASADRLNAHKAEILAAITGNYEPGEESSMNETVALWQNRLGKPAELRIGRIYIRVQDIMLFFLKMVCSSGLLEAVIAGASGQPTGFHTDTSTSCAIAIWELFQSVKTLDDTDFCVYMQALTHWREHKSFTEDELISWFPHGEKEQCNMHNDTWNCTHLGENDACRMLQDDRIKTALASLQSKKFLYQDVKEDVISYKFAR